MFTFVARAEACLSFELRTPNSEYRTLNVEPNLNLNTNREVRRQKCELLPVYEAHWITTKINQPIKTTAAARHMLT
jgi:hypothetical protein